VAEQGKAKKEELVIELRLYTNLARYGGDKIGFFPVVISSSENLGSLIRKFGIPREEISLILINDRLTGDFQAPLQPGDRVRILGLVGGG
jgi:hypothetical protein